jgi:hypothetical protein
MKVDVFLNLNNTSYMKHWKKELRTNKLTNKLELFLQYHPYEASAT